MQKQTKQFYDTLEESDDVEIMLIKVWQNGNCETKLKK